MSIIVRPTVRQIVQATRNRIDRGGLPWEWEEGRVDPRLVIFERDGTFTRNSVAWYSTTPTLAVGSMVQAGVNEPRIRTVDGMREYLGEMSRTNRIQGDSSRLNSASWTTSNATVDSQAVASVFAGESADRINFGASSAASVMTDILGTSDGMVVVGSCIARVESGSASVRFRIIRRDGVANSYTLSLTTQPAVVYFVRSLGTGTTQPEFGFQNNADAIARSIIVDHAQVEDSDLGPDRPTSPIRKGDGAQVTRGSDKLTFPLPQAFVDGVWHIRARFDHASTESIENQTVWAGNAGEFVHLLSGTRFRVRDVGDGVNFSAASFSYAKDDVRHLYGDFRGAGGLFVLRVEDDAGSTLASAASSIGPQFTASPVEYGQASAAGANLNINMGMWLSEPRIGKALA